MVTDCKNKRILVVDDDRTVRELTVAWLRSSYEVHTAASGDEALAIAAQTPPGVVLLDIMMPGIDGYETCRRLRSLFTGEALQIIMVSGCSSLKEQLQAHEAGADAYLVKPIDACVLRSSAQLHFRLRDAVQRVDAMESEIVTARTNLKRLNIERDRQVGATQDVAVFALAKMAESRDEDTGLHLVRVRGYSQILAQELRNNSPYAHLVGDEFLSDLYRSSPLHDIGKVGVSDTILLKPGRLTPDEFDLVKLHTVLGADILEEVVFYSQSGSFLAMAAAIAHYHHERFDGTGYPSGLRGEEIPLAARIVALADVFDALTSKRPYKAAYTPEQSREIVTQESGKHFDPVVVSAFEARFDDLLKVLRPPSDAAIEQRQVDVREVLQMYGTRVLDNGNPTLALTTRTPECAS
jgi:putative two-component system response regulator